MGLLDKLERGLERAVNGAFARAFRSGVQPVEIAAALRKALDTRAAIVSRDRILVPHALTVWLSQADKDRVDELGASLTRELDRILREHAAEQRYSFAGPLHIAFEVDPRLREGMLNVTTESSERVAWVPTLEVAGSRHRLAARSTIGRGEDCTVTLSDTGASRQHAEILWDGQRAVLRDLGSTNGTKVDGIKVATAELQNDAVISIGRTRLIYRLEADAIGSDHGAAPTPNVRGDR